jgi:hypothetical protein
MTPRRESTYAVLVIAAFVVMFVLIVAGFHDAARWEARYVVDHARLVQVGRLCAAAPDGSGTCKAGAFDPPSTTTTTVVAK